jgi:outer membrane cobalamin receptor
MVKKISLFIISLFVVVSVYSQEIFGTVKDKNTKEPLSGATVQVMNTFKGVVSTSDGLFVLKVPSEKEITVKASFIGYSPTTKTFLLKNGEKVEFEFLLVSTTVEQEEVIVTGTRVSTARSNIPLTTSVITEKDIESSAEINLLPLISNSVPGVFVTERGISGFGISTGAAGKISVRGVGSGEQSQLLVMIDGQPQVMGIFGHGFPDMYQTSNFEKVEIIRGPSSVLYGSNAMGGVINMITKKQRNDGFTGKLSAQAGSFETIRGTFTAGYKKDEFSVFGAISHDQTQGARPNSSFTGNNWYVGSSWEMNKNFKIDWIANATDFYAVDPGPENTTTPEKFADNGAWAEVKRVNSMLTIHNRFDKANGHLKVFYNEGNHSIYDNWKSVDRNYGISLFEGLSLFENNLIGVGADWNKYGGKGSPVMVPKFADGSVKMVPSDYNDKWVDVSETGVYAFVQHEFFQRLTLNSGLRYSYHSLYGGSIIPQVGLTFRASSNDHFKALISRGHRSPNVRELYFFPPANPELQPEKLWNYELGYSRLALDGKLKTGITLFYLEGENLILTLPNPAGGLPPMLNQNSGAFKHYGAEVEASYRVSPAFGLNASYSYLHTDVPRVAAPKHQVFAGANYVAGKFSCSLSGNAIIGLHTQTDNKATLEINEEEVQNYVLVNTKINYKLFSFINLFVSGDNLLNYKYSVNYGYPMPGITVLGGFTLYLN